jgi:predicted DNA-binding transcriptional regulator YafY
MAKTERVLRLLELLQDRGPTTGAELARELGTDVRTVRRDVVALRDLGIPVEGERGRGGSYRLKPGYRVPPLMFTAGEAATVALGLLAARRLGLEADAALAKVRRALPERVALGVEALERTLGFTGEVEAAPPDGETLLVLAEAARRGRRVRGRYTDAAGEATTRLLTPYGLVAHGGRWYAPAYDHGRGALRALRADRLHAVRIADGRSAAPPEAFDAVAFVSQQLARVPWAHDVQVVLHTDVVAARRHFPPTLAELAPAGDGLTHLALRAESLDWAAALLAGAGCELTVIGPDGLRDALRRLAARLVAAAA